MKTLEWSRTKSGVGARIEACNAALFVSPYGNGFAATVTTEQTQLMVDHVYEDEESAKADMEILNRIYQLVAA